MAENKITYWTDGDDIVHRLVYQFTWQFNKEEIVSLEKIEKVLRDAIAQCAEMNRWQVHKLWITPLYIRVIIQMGPNIGADEALKLLLKGSEKVLMKSFPELVENVGGEGLWASDYSIETGTDEIKALL